MTSCATDNAPVTSAGVIRALKQFAELSIDRRTMSATDTSTPATDLPKKRSARMFSYGIVICLIVTGVAAVARNVLFHSKPPPPVNDLKFPVAVIFDETDCRIHRDAADLGVMGLMRVMAYKSTPYLVDNELHLFQMENLKSDKSSFGIFLSMGNGSTPVSFTLKAVRDDSHSKARALLGGALHSSLSEEQVVATRNRIQSATTLTETLTLD